jgi:hypothetical protein
VSNLVTLRHPKLPAEQTIRIDRRRIGAHLSAGWEEVVPESTQAAESTPEPPAVEPEPKPESKRSTRKNTEEQ